MDEETILLLLKVKLDVVEHATTALTIRCQQWDSGLGLPAGSTARYIHKAIQGTAFQFRCVAIEP